MLKKWLSLGLFLFLFSFFITTPAIAQTGEQCVAILKNIQINCVDNADTGGLCSTCEPHSASFIEHCNKTFPYPSCLLQTKIKTKAISKEAATELLTSISKQLEKELKLIIDPEFGSPYTCTEKIQNCIIPPHTDCTGEKYSYCLFNPYDPTCKEYSPEGKCTPYMCMGVSRHWYNNSCHESAPCTLANILACKLEEPCVGAGFYWEPAEYKCYEKRPAECLNNTDCSAIKYCETYGNSNDMDNKCLYKGQVGDNDFFCTKNSTCYTPKDYYGNDVGLAICADSRCRLACGTGCSANEYCETATNKNDESKGQAYCKTLKDLNKDCANDPECKSGFCFQDSSNANKKVCREKNNISCYPECEKTEYCTTSLTCSPLKENNEPCNDANECKAQKCYYNRCGASECPVGKYYNGKNCVPQVALGENCTKSMECSEGSCHIGSADGVDVSTCTTLDEFFTECLPNCTSTEYCNDALKCKPKLEDKQPCTEAIQCKNNLCQAGLCGKATGACAKCTEKQYCSENKCLNAKPAGEKCDNDAQCITKKCVGEGENKKCATEASTKKTCTPECVGQQYCDNGACKSKIPLGAPCSTKNPEYCMSGFCRPLEFFCREPYPVSCSCSSSSDPLCTAACKKLTPAPNVCVCTANESRALTENLTTCALACLGVAPPGEESSSGEKEGPKVVGLPNFLGVEDPGDLAARLIKLAMGFVGTLAILVFIYGGTLWVISAGRQNYITDGKNAMIWAGVGMAITFSSYILVNYVFQFFGK